MACVGCRGGGACVVCGAGVCARPSFSFSQASGIVCMHSFLSSMLSRSLDG